MFKILPKVFWGLLLDIDGIIYDLICYVFEIFYYLCGLQIFNNSDYVSIVNKIYVVLGLIMMFVLVYSLLRAVINPDEFAKGENSFPKLIKNVVISLAIIAFLPTAFTLAFNIQNSLIKYDVIPKLVLGDNSDVGANNGVPSVKVDDASEAVSGGRAIAFYTFKAFLTPNTSNAICDSTDSDTCRGKIRGNDGWGQNGTELSNVDSKVLNGDSFQTYTQFSESRRDHQLTYYFPISTAAGIFILYVLLNFCFDMALRVIKLAFYQMIAPIPVICRVIPGGKLKDVFSKWLKQVVSLFVEVFVRIFSLTFGVYLIGIVIIKFNTRLPGIDSLNFVGQKTIVMALLIMSIVIFVKQMPKIIGELFGLDTGGMKLGLMDKLAQGGALAAGAVAGGALGSLGRNAVSAAKNFKAAKGGKDKAKALGAGLLSAGAGAISGGRRGFSAGKNAKSFADAKKAATTAVSGASEAKAKRDAKISAYKASHPNANMAETLLGVGAGNALDTASRVGEFFGINSLDDLKHEKEVADTMQGFYKTMAGYVEDDKMVANYAGLYEAERKREISNTVFDEKAYNTVLKAKYNEVMRDRRYANMTAEQKKAIATAQIDKSNFVRNRTQEEYEAAVQERADNLKRLDDLKKIATIKAVNEKLNKKDADGNIIDGRFAAVVNEASVFKNQNANYDFVNSMSEISGVNWDASWDTIMKSGNGDAIASLLDNLKSDPTLVSFFADSETGKNRSGAVSAQIAKKIQEKKNNSE